MSSLFKNSKKDLATKIKEILNSEEFQKEILDKVKQDELKIKTIINKNYPGHNEHQQVEIDCEYFDAMFVSVTFECSCGVVIKLTREMF